MRKSPVSADLKFRAVVQLLTTPYGRKVELADRLALELGRCRRSILSWQTEYKRNGPVGLVHGFRADKGASRIYTAAHLKAIASLAPSLQPGQYRKAYRNLEMPGTYEAFRSWLNRFKSCRYIEQREARSA